MHTKTKNEIGTIAIDYEVIARVAGLAAMDSYGVVGMAAKSIRDGISHVLKRESLTKGIIVSRQDEFINIDLHIIVEYGTNISAISQSLIDAVKYRVEEYVGVNVLNVNIYVDGIRLNSSY